MNQYQQNTVGEPMTTTLTKTFSETEIASLAQDFLRQGYIILPEMISPEVCAEMRAEIDRIERDVPAKHPEQGYGEPTRCNLFHYSKLFADYIDFSPIVDIAEAILGPKFHLIANASAKSDRNFAVSDWHVDEEVMFPLPEGVEHDERVQIPCHAVNTQWYLTDVPTVEDGPTQIVPYSHRSGRPVPKLINGELPSYRGHQTKSFLVKAGTIAFQHSQTWHRGGPVSTDNVRVLLQYSYGRRSFSQRMYPFNGYKTPEHVLEGASARKRRLLGFHERSWWG